MAYHFDFSIPVNFEKEKEEYVKKNYCLYRL